MTAKKRVTTDVLIVGAGPLGSFLAWRLARAGCAPLLIDARPLDAIGWGIEVFHMDLVRFEQFGIPHPAGEELLHREPGSRQWFPDQSGYLEIPYPFYVLKMPAYIGRIQRYAREEGAEVRGEMPVTGLIVEDGWVKGVVGDSFEIRAGLTVDASGIAGAVRTRLPDGFGVENDPVPVPQTFYCVLELRDGLPEGHLTGSNGFTHVPGFWNRGYGDGAILGMVIPGSLELAWERHREWREREYGDPGRLVSRRAGCAPYRRPPYSLVGNGFLGVGDAVYHNKAFSGEGVASGCTGCAIAAEVIAEALGNGDFSRASLWPYNVRYNRGQGARFAGTMAFFPRLGALPGPEVNRLHHEGILYSGPELEALNRNYELDLSDGAWEGTLSRLRRLEEAGGISRDSIAALDAARRSALSIRAHYGAYPETPAGLDDWAPAAARFWGY